MKNDFSLEYKSIGLNIAYYRKQKNLTQEQVAEVLGVSTQTISRWECNTTCPDIMLLPGIARLYCVTVDDLFKENSSAYENYAQRLASVYEITHKAEDYLTADIEFNKLKKSGDYTLEDCRIHGVIHSSMMCSCKRLAIKNFNHIINEFEKENNIPLLFSFGLGPGGEAWLHIGSSHSSMTDFWAGTGILELREDGTIVERILSRNQYENIKNDLIDVEIESPISNICKSLSTIKVYKGKLTF